MLRIFIVSIITLLLVNISFRNYIILWVVFKIFAWEAPMQKMIYMTLSRAMTNLREAGQGFDRFDLEGFLSLRLSWCLR